MPERSYLRVEHHIMMTGETQAELLSRGCVSEKTWWNQWMQLLMLNLIKTECLLKKHQILISGFFLLTINHSNCMHKI